MKVYGSKVNANATINFINNCIKNNIYIHSYRYYKDNILISACDIAPYTGKEKVQLYSMSKSFTSIACGIASDEGILSVDERMCDIFPDKMPISMSEKLKKMRLCDVLSMQSGHERCVLDEMLKSGDALKTFFAHECVYDPGTTFVYSSGGTCVCGAAVTRRSGESLDEYLYKRMFSKLGIDKPRWDRTPDGICLGGIGIYVSVDDLAKFGTMLLNGGVYEGKRIISEKYLKEAVKAHSVDINNGSRDWIAGYGYQFWLNADGGFRGDGAFGQLCIVLPESNELFVILCEAGSMQTEMNIIYDFIKESKLEDTALLSDAEELARTLYLPKKTLPIEHNIKYRCGENINRVFGFELSPNGKELIFDIDCDFGKQRFICGNESFILNENRELFGLSPAISQMHDYRYTEHVNVYCAYSADEKGITVIFRYADIPHTSEWRFENKKLTLTAKYGDLRQREFELYEY